MLNLIKSLNYEINADGVVQKVHVGFSEYNGNPGGSINVTILPEEVEGEFLEMTPNQIKEVAKMKVINAMLNGESIEDLSQPQDPQPAE